MIFSMGTTFIFSSWICKADDNNKLQSYLMEIPTPQASPDVSMITLDQLTEKFSHLSISDSTQTQEVTINHDSYSDTSLLFGLEIPYEVQLEDPVHFPLGLKNSASIYQDTISHLMQSEQEIPLAGAQRGLVFHYTRRRHHPLAGCSTRHLFNRSILSSWHGRALALSRQ